MKRAFLLALLFAAAPVWGQRNTAPSRRNLPDFDARDFVAAGERATVERAQSNALVERRKAALESLQAAEAAANPGTRITPNRYGLPKMYFREGKALTAVSSADPEAIARNFLKSRAAAFSLTAAEIDGLRLVTKDAAGDATYLAFNQTVGGIDVFNAQIKFTLSKAGEIVQASAGEAAPGLSVSLTPRLSPDQAVSAAFRAAGLRKASTPSRLADADGKASFANPRGSGGRPVTAELTIFPLTADSARLAYRIFLDVDARSWYEILIDAGDGGLLFRHNLYARAAQGKVFTQSPAAGTRQTVTFPASWFPANGKVTSGNNTDTYLDQNGDDVPDAITDSETSNGRAYSATQNFSFDFKDGTTGQDPGLYYPAAITNLFYFVNTAHDYFYGLGFTEAAGNFQVDNFGKGGLGNDPVLAEAQYGGFADSTQFVSTPDGTPPVMRMGFYTQGTQSFTDDLDSDVDGQLAIHEYAHGVSNRLVGAGVSTSCLLGLQSAPVGEGWSDYFAISYFNNPVFGAYSFQNSARGLRRQSYEGYTYTYEDLGNSGYWPHDDGEIWAATLWDLRKALGQTITDKLVINGMKSTPCSPSVTEARDAILSADLATNGGANQNTLWKVFARHGLGYSAYGEDGGVMTGTRYDAGYDLPPGLQATGNPIVTSDPRAVSVGAGQNYSYHVTATNPNGGSLSYSLAQGPAGMTVDPSGTVAWTASFTGRRVKITVTDKAGGKVVHGYYLHVITDLSSGVPLTINGDLGTEGVASITVPPNTPVLQVSTRGGAGDADLYVVDPSGNYSYSQQTGNAETMSFVNPVAGIWTIDVFGYEAYSGTSLKAALIVPTPLSPAGSLTGLNGDFTSEAFYRVTLPAGATAFSVSTTGGTGNADLFLRGGQPAACQNSDVVTSPCLYDNYSTNSGNSEFIGLTNPAAGDWYLDLTGTGDGVAGFSGVTLKTETNSAKPLFTTLSPLPSGLAGLAYSVTLGATGGTTPYAWSKAAGTAPPAGLTLDGGTGVISGIPAVPGVYSFAIQVKDKNGASAIATFALTISGPSVSTSAALPTGLTRTPYSAALSASGGTPPYTWKLASGSLPAGLSVAGSGAITGTPTAAGSYSFSLRVTDSANATTVGQFTMKVIAAGNLTRIGVLSQVAAGTGWDTAIWITNDSSAAASVKIAFHADDGTPLVLPFAVTQQGQVTSTVSDTLIAVIEPKTTLVAQTSAMDVYAQGWAEVISDGAPNGFAVFRYAPYGLAPDAPGFVTPWEGTVPLQTQLTPSIMILPFDNTGGFKTGVAIANLSAAAADYTATFFDDGGATLGTAPVHLDLNAHKAFMVDSIAPFTVDKRGILRFTGPAMGGIGLRASPYGTLTSVPTVLQ